MSDASPSLDSLQDIVRRRRQQSASAPGRDVAVDRDGQIVVVEYTAFGTVLTPGGRPVSRVPKDTFAASDQDFVNNKMPSNAYRVEESGIKGWMYEVNTGAPYYEDYTMFIYFSNNVYYVKLVDPNYAGQAPVHECHLWPDGKLCLSSDAGGGYRDIEQAYGKSVLWAKGYSEYRRIGTFPF